MKRFLVLFLHILFLQVADAQTLQIDSFLQNRMKEFAIPALSAAVIEDGKVVFSKAYGFANLEYGIANTAQTAFQLASCTKLISATAITTLVQNGKLDLAERVRTYLPELPQSWNEMKVMDLVAHQSGVADLLALQRNFTSLQQALDTATARPLDFKPGTKTVYAGGDYAVVMRLIERLTGKTFQQFLQETVLDKLGMGHTVFNNMEQDFIYRTYDTIPYAATVYTFVKERKQQRIFSLMFPSWTYPAGGLFSSLEDLTRWAVALDRNTLLTPEYTEKMWTSTTLRNGNPSPFGVGWIVDKHNGEKVTGHSGGPALADIMRLPQRKITVIVLTNQMELRPFLSGRVLDLYLKYKR